MNKRLRVYLEEGIKALAKTAFNRMLIRIYQDEELL